MSLPRTTESQAREGAPIGRNELVAGDLVFFRPSKRSNHAGIYLSGGRFAHISSAFAAVTACVCGIAERTARSTSPILEVSTPSNS